MKRKLIWIILFLAVFLLTACGGQAFPPAVDPRLQETFMAATISARLTEIYLQTQIAVLSTQAAMPTATATLTPTETPVPPTPTPTVTQTPVPTATKTKPPIPCNNITFKGDVTVPDGTEFEAGASFTKTWLLQNTGTCTWTKDYKLVFVSGNAMSGPASQKLNVEVKPGETLQISVNLVAPGESGTHTGYWMLQNASGGRFGMGADSGTPFWVKIKVNAYPKLPSDVVVDFAKEYCSAYLETNKGELTTCPSPADDFTNGSIYRTFKPKFENKSVDDEQTLVMIPGKGSGGYILAEYKSITVPAGARFQTVIGCMYDQKDCDVVFQVRYRVIGSPTETLGEWTQIYDGNIEVINEDLSALEGQKVVFTLRVWSNDNNTNDKVFWLFPRITK